jgi:hypothetical protein
MPILPIRAPILPNQATLPSQSSCLAYFDIGVRGFAALIQGSKKEIGRNVA